MLEGDISGQEVDNSPTRWMACASNNLIRVLNCRQAVEATLCYVQSLGEVVTLSSVLHVWSCCDAELCGKACSLVLPPCICGFRCCFGGTSEKFSLVHTHVLFRSLMIISCLVFDEGQLLFNMFHYFCLQIWFWFGSVLFRFYLAWCLKFEGLCNWLGAIHVI